MPALWQVQLSKPMLFLQLFWFFYGMPVDNNKEVLDLIFHIFLAAFCFSVIIAGLAVVYDLVSKYMDILEMREMKNSYDKKERESKVN
jgi:hypothetical protein